MMNTIIKSPIDLPDQQIEEFAHIFRVSNYTIVTLTPSQQNMPEFIMDSYKNRETYRKILNDPASDFKFFAISYTTAKNESVVTPVGLFGISEKHKVRFPLIVNGFWETFLMGNKEAFYSICNINRNKENDFYYTRFSDLKKKLIYNIFKYYFTLGESCSSTMSWNIRGKESNTRSIAESLGFHRIENRGMEIYSSNEMTQEKQEYLKNCVLRWGIVVEARRASVQVNPTNVNANARLLVRNMVNCSV